MIKFVEIVKMKKLSWFDSAHPEVTPFYILIRLFYLLHPERSRRVKRRSIADFNKLYSARKFFSPNQFYIMILVAIYMLINSPVYSQNIITLSEALKLAKNQNLKLLYQDESVVSLTESLGWAVIKKMVIN